MKGQTVFLTGGTGGIGYQTTRALARMDRGGPFGDVMRVIT